METNILTMESLSPTGFCKCGCGKKTNIVKTTVKCKGYFAGQPRPFIRGHSYSQSQEIKETRYWSQVRFDVSGCWIWTGNKDDKGYGRCWDVRPGAPSKQRKAHQISYNLLIGEVPDGMELDHLCRTRSCVNPYHLEPVTHAVNMTRGANTKLSEGQVIEILMTLDSTAKELASRHGVSHHTIQAIRFWGLEYRASTREGKRRKLGAA